MQFDFIDEQITDTQLEEAEIIAEERKLNIRFPEALRQLYLISNGCYVRELTLIIENYEYDIEEILPLNRTKLTVSYMKDKFSDNPEVPSNYIPFAINSAEGVYFWDSLTGEIWFVAENSYLKPVFMFNSIQEMFNAMNLALSGNGYAREKREEGFHYLPAGSVVRLHKGSKKVIIVGRGMIVEVDGIPYFFDYIAASYPEGIRGNEFIYINHSWIQTVLFNGYHDDEDTIVDQRLHNYLNNHSDLPHYPMDMVQI